MKSKLLITTGLLMGMAVSPVQAGMFIPSMSVASMSAGIALFDPGSHFTPICCAAIGCPCPDVPSFASIWIDPLMAVATALDWAATKSHDTRTVKAGDAIQKLEDALKPLDKKEACWVELALDDSVATIYTTENIQAVISAKKTRWDRLFKNIRTEVEEYLFETPDGKIKGDCTMSDRDCAIERQNEWMLASTTLASATADKVLDKTARGEEETSMKQHFERLKKHFKSRNIPADMYAAMAEIVLDTHRQMNEANALLGRDLEAQGLRAAHESGPVFFPRPDETEE